MDGKAPKPSGEVEPPSKTVAGLLGGEEFRQGLLILELRIERD